MLTHQPLERSSPRFPARKGRVSGASGANLFRRDFPLCLRGCKNRFLSALGIVHAPLPCLRQAIRVPEWQADLGTGNDRMGFIDGIS